MSGRARTFQPLGIAGALLCALASSATATTTFVVNSRLDEVDLNVHDSQCLTAAGTCTLRAAIMQANRMTDYVNITLPGGEPYKITLAPTGFNGDDSGDFNVTGPEVFLRWITITGDGPATTIIDADHRDRIFTIHTERSFFVYNVTLRNGSSGFGGAIAVEGGETGVALGNCVLEGNEALGTGTGGAIWSAGFVILSNGSTLQDNKATRGGAVYLVGNGASLDATNVTLTTNQATQTGGAIHNEGDGSGNNSVTLRTSTVSGNTAGTYGGGIYNADGSLRVIQSTVSGNAAFTGGGIANLGYAEITNTTISTNRADQYGGGVVNDVNGECWVYSSTIAFNRADDAIESVGGNGAGVYNGPSATFGLRNSVLAGNTLHRFAPVYDDCSGPMNTYGYNMFVFVNFSVCALSHAGACGGQDLALTTLDKLGPLQLNGGITKTHALKAGSSLIDAVESPCICQGTGGTLDEDQREGARIVGPRCDIGAVEWGSQFVDLAIFSDGFESGNRSAWVP